MKRQITELASSYQCLTRYSGNTQTMYITGPNAVYVGELAHAMYGSNLPFKIDTSIPDNYLQEANDYFPH